MVHLRYIAAQKDRTDPERRPLEGARMRVARMRHQRPCRRPLSSEAREGCSGLVGDACGCARQLDGGLESTADDHHTTLPSTVTQMFVVGADPEHAACTGESFHHQRRTAVRDNM